MPHVSQDVGPPKSKVNLNNIKKYPIVNKRNIGRVKRVKYISRIYMN